MPATTLPAYRSRPLAGANDLVNRMLWLPAGSDRLRRSFVDRLGVPAGSTVLELGCGTGLVTRHLLAAGASVEAVDGSAPMLERARRRAPQARYRQADLTGPDGVAGDDARSVDVVVLAFVLHELYPDERATLLARSACRVTPSGTIGILDWGRPAGWRGRIWSALVGAIEPRRALDVLDHGIRTAISAAGLRCLDEAPLAGGRARMVVVGAGTSGERPADR